MVTGQIAHVRSSVRARTAKNLLTARPLFTQYNYADKFPKARKGAKGNGIRFEKAVGINLQGRFPGYIDHMPFEYFTADRGRAVCLPDGLLLFDGTIIICEIKLRHTVDAWFQLRHLYYPVVAYSFGLKVRMLEICKFYNHEESFPEPFQTVFDINDFLRAKTELGCLIWGK